MPRRISRTRDQGNTVCLICFAILGLVIFFFNMIVVDYYGLGLVRPPWHENPHNCELNGFQLCTTSEGKCTKKKKQCVFPKKQEDCTYVNHKNEISKSLRQDIRFKFKKESERKMQIKRRQSYCAKQIVLLYSTMESDLKTFGLVLAYFLAIILFCLFICEICQFSEWVF